MPCRSYQVGLSVDTDKVMSGLTLILKYLSKGIVPMLVDLREELSCTWIGTEIKVFLGVGHLLHVLGKQIYYPLSQGRIHEFTRGKGFVYPFLMQYT